MPAKLTGSVTPSFKHKNLIVSVNSWDPASIKEEYWNPVGDKPIILLRMAHQGNNDYPHCIICKPETSINLQLSLAAPAWGFHFEVSAAQDDPNIPNAMMAKNEMSSTTTPWNGSHRSVHHYTEGPFKDKAFLVDSIAGMKAHGLNWKNSWRLDLKVQPVTSWVDTAGNGASYGPGFPPQPPQAMAAMTSLVSEPSPFMSMAVVSNEQTINVSGAGVRGGENTDPDAPTTEADWALDTSTQGTILMSIWVFVAADDQFIKTHVDAQTQDASAFE